MSTYIGSQGGQGNGDYTYPSGSYVPQMPTPVSSLQVNFMPDPTKKITQDTSYLGGLSGGWGESPMARYFGEDRKPNDPRVRILNPADMNPADRRVFERNDRNSHYDFQNPKQMFSAIQRGNLDIDRLSTQIPDLQRAFQGAAQHYANLYNSPGFRSSTGAIPQRRNADWLQASYSSLIGKLNDAYAL